MFEKMKANRKAKADEKKSKQIAVTADTLESANARRVNARHMNEEKLHKLETEKWHERYLDKESMRENVNKVRTNLFIQKDKLCRRIINANKERAYIKNQPENFKNGFKYVKEIERCQKETKQSYYALDVVMQWINSVDNVEDEYEWQTIMKDLTTNYKVIHEISDDTGLLLKLAFLINNAKLTNKGKISLTDIENEYKKDINQLLDEVKTNKSFEDLNDALDIDDNVYELMNEDEVYDSIEWGTCKKNHTPINNTYNDISRIFPDNKPSSAGETEKVTDNSDMNEPHTEMAEPPTEYEETFYNSETNSEREVISDDFNIETSFY